MSTPSSLPRHHSGHNVKLFVDAEKAEDLLCPICLDVCRDAVETSCAHIFCERCLDSALAVKAECPLDHQPLTKKSQVRVAGFVRRTVSNLKVFCRYHDSGCGTTLPLADVSAHEESCPFATVVCSQCNVELQARLLDRHLVESCPCREVSCSHCGTFCPQDELEIHQSIYCPAMPVSCPNECGEPPMARSDLMVHMNKACPMQSLKCRYWRHGCKTHVRRSELAQHMESEAAVHLDLVERFYQQELAKTQRESMEMLRFSMRVGSSSNFAQVLDAIGPDNVFRSVKTVIQGMKLFMYDASVLERSCMALIKLCEAGSGKPDVSIGAIVACDGVRVIIDTLTAHPSEIPVQELALKLLRKMATNAEVKSYVQHNNDEVDCLGEILRAMQTHSSVMVIQRDAIGVLLNMAVNDAIEQRIGQIGGIQAILRAMDRFSDNGVLVQLACHALFHLTFDENNKQRLFASGALRRLIKATSDHMRHTNCVYYALRAMAQLAKVETYRSKLRRLGVRELAERVMGLHPSHRDLQKKAKMLVSRLVGKGSSSSGRRTNSVRRQATNKLLEVNEALEDDDASPAAE